MLSHPDKHHERRGASLARTTLAYVLAGGRGSRLSHLTDWRAKPAVPFGGKFRIIDFPLSNCLNSGVRRVFVATQYKSQSLTRHLQRGWGFLRGEMGEFVEAIPAQQRIGDEWYRGTADALWQNIDIIEASRVQRVLVLAGDHVYKMDYSIMLAEHEASSQDVSIACMEAPVATAANAFGVMETDASGRIVGFEEKPEHPKEMPGRPGWCLASMGIYVFRIEALREVLQRTSSDETGSHDFGKDLIPMMVAEGRAHSHLFSSSVVCEPGKAPYWRDVGTVDSYWEANMDLASLEPELNLYDRDWPIWTYQEQLPPAKFVLDEEGGRAGRAQASLVSGGCVVSGALVRGSVLFSDVRVDECLIESCALLPGVVVGKKARLHRCIVDKNCVIPQGLVVGEDAQSDKERFFVSEGGITLITRQMLGQRTPGA